MSQAKKLFIVNHTNYEQLLKQEQSRSPYQFSNMTSEIVTEISHNLSNPLQIIYSAAELLKTTYTDSSSNKEVALNCVDKILKATERIDEVLRELKSTKPALVKNKKKSKPVK